MIEIYLDIIHDIYLTEPQKQEEIALLFSSLSKEDMDKLIDLIWSKSGLERTEGPEKKV